MQAAGLIACAVTILAWGAAGIFDKLGVKGVDPFSAVLVRMVIGTVVILIMCAATGRVRPVLEFSSTTILCLALSALLGSLVGQLAYFVALKTAPVSLVVPVTATYPVVAVLLAAMILREQPTLPRIAGVVLVVIGLMLVSSGQGNKSTPPEEGTPSSAVSAIVVSDDEPPEGGV